MSDSDSLIVCAKEAKKIWIIVLQRNGDNWSERARTGSDIEQTISCALNDSRVLIGHYDSNYIELFRLNEDNPVIERVQSFSKELKYASFSAKSFDRDTLVAMSYKSPDKVCVKQLRDNKLEMLAEIELNKPRYLLWIDKRLLATEDNSYSVSELLVPFGSNLNWKLERRYKPIRLPEGIILAGCAVENGFAIHDFNSRNILNYELRF